MDLNKAILKIVCVFSLITLTVFAPIHAEAIRTVANGGLDSFSQNSTSADWLEPWKGNGNTNIGFTINLFGDTVSSLWVRPQGFVTTANIDETRHWAHIDFHTNNEYVSLSPYQSSWDPVNNPAPYGTAVINERDAFVVSWIDVGSQGDSTATGSFQLVLIDRSDTGSGNFDMEFNYSSINNDSWAGNKAMVGFTSGNGDAQKWQLPGSGTEDQFRDTDPTPVIAFRNTATDKARPSRIAFESRNGVMSTPTLTTDNFTLPAVITLNITAQNTLDVFSLGGLSLNTTELLVQSNTYTPITTENFTFKLINPHPTFGQFTDITLPPLGNGLGWDLSDLYTTGSLKVIRSPDKLSTFKPYVWLDASDVGSLITAAGDITKWIDKSGNNNHLIQTTASLMPTKIDAQLNNFPILRFNGSQYMDFPSQLFSGTAARTIIAIMKKSNTDTGVPIYSETSSTTPQFFELRSDRLQYGIASSIDFRNELLTNTQFKVLIATIDSGDDIGQLQVYTKGIPRNELNLTSAMNTAVSGISGIARDSNTTDFFTGDLAELLIYDRKLAPWEIDKITHYYAQKYTITSNSGRNHPSIF